MPRRPLVLERVCFSNLFTFAGQNCFLEYVLMCLVFISALLFLNLKKCFAFKVMFCLKNMPKWKIGNIAEFSL